eukprot:5475728-Amphidinium_carterae.1
MEKARCVAFLACKRHNAQPVRPLRHASAKVCSVLHGRSMRPCQIAELVQVSQSARAGVTRRVWSVHLKFQSPIYNM